MNKHYFKCIDCLTPVMTLEKNTNNHTCDCGGSEFEYMGKVTGSYLTQQTEVCKCNELCAHAAGPSCSCACNGQNHGDQMKAYEVKNEITGMVTKRVKGTAKALSHGVWYREQKQKLSTPEAYGRLTELKQKIKKNGRTWPFTDDMYLVSRIDRLISDFKDARTFKKREQLVNKIAELTA